jgi:hypothetical protein
MGRTEIPDGRSPCPSDESKYRTVQQPDYDCIEDSGRTRFCAFFDLIDQCELSQAGGT